MLYTIARVAGRRLPTDKQGRRTDPIGSRNEKDEHQRQHTQQLKVDSEIDGKWITNVERSTNGLEPTSRAKLHRTTN